MVITYFLRVLRSHIAVILVSVGLCALGCFLFLGGEEPYYASSVIVGLRTDTSAEIDLGDEAKSLADLLGTESFQSHVEKPGAATVEIGALDSGDFISIEVHADQAAVCDDVIKQEIELVRDVAPKYFAGVEPILVEEGEVPPHLVGGRSRMTSLVLGAAGGLLVGIVVSLLLELMSPYFKSAQEAEKALDLPVLAEFTNAGAESPSGPDTSAAILLMETLLAKSNDVSTVMLLAMGCDGVALSLRAFIRQAAARINYLPGDWDGDGDDGRDDRGGALQIERPGDGKRLKMVVFDDGKDGDDEGDLGYLGAASRCDSVVYVIRKNVSRIAEVSHTAAVLRQISSHAVGVVFCH